jgi:hypothetical protein
MESNESDESEEMPRDFNSSNRVAEDRKQKASECLVCSSPSKHRLRNNEADSQAEAMSKLDVAGDFDTEAEDGLAYGEYLPPDYQSETTEAIGKLIKKATFSIWNAIA